MDDNDLNTSIPQIKTTINQDDELDKDKNVKQSGDSEGEYSSLGSAGPEDDPDGDIDGGGVMDIDKAREAVGERSDGDWEHRNELTDDDLNLNASDDMSTPRTDDEEELEKAA
jgi:hypothetical protein